MKSVILLISMLFIGGQVIAQTPLEAKFQKGLVLYLHSFTDKGTNDASPARQVIEEKGRLTKRGWRTKMQADYVDFDGKSGMLFVDSSLGLQSKSITLSFSVKIPTAFESGPFVMIGGHRNGFAVGVGENSFDAKGNNVIVEYNDSQIMVSSKTLKPDVWYHILVIIDRNGSPSLYVNNSRDSRLKYKKGNKFVQPQTGDGSGIHIGGCDYRYKRSANYFNDVKKYTRCSIDNVAIFNIAVSGVVKYKLAEISKK